MEYDVRITVQAQEHLRKIRDYIAIELSSPDTAKKMLVLLQTEMASLAQMPNRVRLVEEEPWREKGIHVKAVKNYLIYFWISDEAHLVQIIAVIYAKRNQVKALSSLDLQ